MASQTCFVVYFYANVPYSIQHGAVSEYSTRDEHTTVKMTSYGLGSKFENEDWFRLKVMITHMIRFRFKVKLWHIKSYHQIKICCSMTMSN